MSAAGKLQGADKQNVAVLLRSTRPTRSPYSTHIQRGWVKHFTLAYWSDIEWTKHYHVNL